jgi:hypothetical protein
MPINVFISYSEYDEKFKNQLDTHLSQLRREGTIRLFHNQQVQAGQEWGKAIASYINSAQIILLLMSPSYLASDHLYENEMMRAIKRQQSGEAVRVIPIVVRHIDLGNTPFQKLQGLPRNGRPIETWRKPDDAWSSIAQEIRDVCSNLRESMKKS